MKILWQNLIVLLSFVAYNYICLAKDNIKVGAFFDGTQPLDSITWNVIRDHIREGTEYQEPDIKTVLEGDSFQAAKIFCEAAADNTGYSAIFGPKDSITSATIESICSYLQIPYMLTKWTPIFKKEYSSTFKLYPDANLLSQGLTTIVKSLDWSRVVVIYENEESLAKMQDILKLQQFIHGQEKNDVMVKHLGSGPDYRAILKNVAGEHPRRIVLDCHVDKIFDIMTQAKEIKLLDDISTSVFLTSLDAHTLNLKELKINANITTIRLFDPKSEHVERVVSRYYPTIPPEKLQVEAALQYDAMMLFAKSLNALLINNPDTDFSSEPKFCNSTEEYKDSLGIIEQMHEETVEGLTGEFKLENGRRETFTLEVIEFDNPDKPIAIWNSEKPEDIYLTRNATEREKELQKRLQSYNFIVCSKLGKPYLMEVNETGKIGNARYRGYSMDLITEVANLMNITFQFVLAYKNQATSIIDDLINRRADLGICDFTITQQRNEVIDFSLPFMSLGISILHKETPQEEIDNMYGFMRPFKWTVWIYIITLFLCLSLVLVLISRLDPDDWENPHPCNQNPEELENIWGIKNCLWLTLGSIMTQGCDILPKGICSRIATAMWWFFSLIMTSTYTANLAAFLTMQKKEDSINSVDDLANQNKIKYGVMTGGSTQTFFQYSNNSLYQKMWATMKNENPSTFEESNDKGVERVLSTKQSLYAFFMESPQIEYELERKCELKKIGQWLDSKNYGIGMPLGAEYRHAINAAVLHLGETGKLSELKEKWWKKEDLDGEPCSNDGGEGKKDELGLANVGGVFVVLGAGIGLAFFFAIVEFLWNVHNISVEEHMTYLEALKCELKFACNITVTKKAAKPTISESSSENSEDARSVARTILAGAGSFLNINASVLNRLGHLANADE
nr:glutamate receptor ionotropic 2 [Pachyrhinus yasumatsui]